MSGLNERRLLTVSYCNVFTVTDNHLHFIIGRRVHVCNDDVGTTKVADSIAP